MRTIRRGTFETNSSSAHSITVMRKEDWENFKKGEAFITEEIKRYSSEDGYYNMTAQMINPESFVDFEGLKAHLKDKIKEGHRHYDILQKFCTYNSFVEAKEASTEDDDLEEFIDWNLSDYVGIYDSDDECGWGMANVSEGDFGVPIVSVDREICC